MENPIYIINYKDVSTTLPFASELSTLNGELSQEQPLPDLPIQYAGSGSIHLGRGNDRKAR
jgi:hypothetical protein